jgi:hypothetical protein
MGSSRLKHVVGHLRTATLTRAADADLLRLFLHN